MSSSIASLVMVIGLWLCLTLLCCGSRSLKSADSYKATYDVVGTGSASLTYTNQGGDSEQMEVSLPWSKSFTVHDGDVLYISAQNKNDYGSITTYISINGSPRKTSTSSGGYVIATSSYRCCE
jgi:hypothetical protein